MIAAAIFVIFPICMALAAFSDFFSMTIPNRVSAILLGSFIIIAPFTGMDLMTFGEHMAAGAVVFVACFALFALNVMGGGDAKLLTASAVWFGLGMDLVAFLVNVSFLGGLLTIAFVVLRAQGDTLLATRVPLPAHFHDRNAGIPYGIAIGIGGFLSFAQSEMMQVALRMVT